MINKKSSVAILLSLTLALSYTSAFADEKKADDNASKTVISKEVSKENEKEDAEYAKKMARENTMSVLWYQNAVEAKALYIQGYNIAKVSLDKKLENLKKSKSKKTPAIALDIDETVLDNSPQQGFFVEKEKSYPEGWNEWVHYAKAKPVPGAKKFLNYAHKKGVEVFYISDRKLSQLDDTIKNLKEQGLPCADKEHVLLKAENDKSKEGRRNLVKKNHKLLMLFGDNIVDFIPVEGMSVEERKDELKKIENKFGDTYIIFPNPMYGSWEAVLFDYNYRQPAKTKDKIRHDNIKIYDYTKEAK